ncbi:MAG TPA: cobalamin-independent methionine synthase II family protein [Caulobacteraceae bacterium]|jgi:5-methyltetrahydropteroyltriglutamate--homocysteine methyltransferase|nr:cobalamin-independent methionine synthase II family protein [Caulobacteraceae bacterium]
MRSDGRILTTHVGSLPRPQAVVDQVFAEDRGEPVDRAVYDRVIGEAVAAVVRRQAECGVDVVSDGEMSKIGYATYIRHRLSGFELGEVPRATPADLDAYPRFRDRQAAEGVAPKYRRPICRGPIAYVNRAPMETDFAHMKAALAGVDVAGAFMNAPSPGVIALFQPNEYYKSREEYLYAVADAMKTEYEAVVAAGLYLQIDSPDLAMGRHIMYRNDPDAAFVRAVDLHVEVLNHALRDVPAERVRLHLCWGNYEGPHHCDIDLDKIVQGFLKAKPSTILFEAANPRHEHEWSVWRDAKIPEDKILVPGVISSTTNYIEHPKLVAERLSRFVDFAGVGRVTAGSDCGFGTWAGFGVVDPDICWAKLKSLAEGAAMASARARVA